MFSMSLENHQHHKEEKIKTKIQGKTKDNDKDKDRAGLVKHITEDRKRGAPERRGRRQGRKRFLCLTLPQSSERADDAVIDVYVRLEALLEELLV